MLKFIKTYLEKHPNSARRSPKWASVRRAHLLAHSQCVVCGGIKKLEVHHVIPFHLHPELELEASNLITLCENNRDGVNCHLFVGHLGSFKSYNSNVRDDAETWRQKILWRPGVNDPSYLSTN